MSRRAWLDSATCGFGSLALHNMVCQSAMADPASLPGSGAHQQPRAKRVIFLFMAGGPSQSDLFDPKPYISKRHGETIDAPVNNQQIRVGVDQFIAMGPVAPVRPRGQCGMTMSDLLPNLGSVADELCLLQALHTDNKAHAPATLQFHTGTLSDVRPSMGSWISYGLGSENNNLPGFITIHPPGDGRTYGASFLPASHQGTPLRVPENSKERHPAFERSGHHYIQSKKTIGFPSGPQPELANSRKTGLPDDRDHGIVRVSVSDADGNTQTG